MTRKFIERILRLLKSLGFLKNIYKVIYQGQGVSLNQYYAGGHWSMRYKLKDKYKNIFLALFEDSNLQKFDSFYLLMFFNSRHDTDNVVGLEKLFVDTIKGIYVKEDDKRFYKGLMIFHDDTLPSNTFEFHILEDGNTEHTTSSGCKTQTELFEVN